MTADELLRRVREWGVFDATLTTHARGWNELTWHMCEPCSNGRSFGRSLDELWVGFISTASLVGGDRKGL